MKTDIIKNSCIYKLQLKHKFNLTIITFTLLAVILSITQCKKKEEKFIIKGVVTEAISGKPISGCTLNLSSNTIQNGVYSSGFSTIGTTTTDANGAYNFEVPVEKTVNFKISTNKTNYFKYELEFDIDNLKDDNTFTNNITLDPEALITIAAKNLYFFDGNDKIAFKYRGSAKSCSECCTNDFTVFKGNVNDSITCKIIGNSMALIEYATTKNGNTQVHLDSVYCPAFQTSRLQINF